MPAAELSRLRAQINELIIRFEDPESFRLALRDLLELYANRAYRPGKVVQPQSIFPSYRVPPLVIRQLELELSKTCQEMPDQALNVVESIWNDPFLEPRLLAAVLLGALPAKYGPAVAEKLRAWSQPAVNFRLLEALFKNGAVELRRSNPQLLVGLIEEWISSTQPEIQAIGLWALVPMVQDPVFENIPAVYRIIGPLVQNIPSTLQTDLTLLIEALIQRSPAETAFFLRQAITLAASSSTARLVRRSLPSFTPDQQSSLRAALQAADLR